MEGSTRSFLCALMEVTVKVSEKRLASPYAGYEGRHQRQEMQESLGSQGPTRPHCFTTNGFDGTLGLLGTLPWQRLGV